MQASEDQLKTWMVEGLNGDASAHASLLRALVPLLSAFYRRRIGDDDAIEDLVQETLIAVHTRRISYDRSRPFLAWLFAVARHKMIDHFRRATCSIDDFADVLVSEGFETEVGARMDIDRLLGELPDKQAQSIRQTHIEGHSTAEAAARSGIGKSDVKVSVHRGLKALASLIGGGRR